MYENEALELFKKIKTQIQGMTDELDALIRKMQTGQEQVFYYPLTEDTSKFKGRKPTELIFPDSRKIEVKKWKQVVIEILKDCNSDRNCHNKLMELRGKVSGKTRCFLQATPEGMDSPEAIDNDIYFETKLDTESLLKFLFVRVLPYLPYEREGIIIGMKI